MKSNSRLSNHLKKAVDTIKLLGISAEEAERITGMTKRHLLRLHREGDYRVIAYQIGREVIFDKGHLLKTKKSLTPRKRSVH